MKNNYCKVVVALIALVMFGVAIPAPVVGVQYNIVDLGTLPGGGGELRL